MFLVLSTTGSRVRPVLEERSVSKTSLIIFKSKDSGWYFGLLSICGSLTPGSWT